LKKITFPHLGDYAVPIKFLIQKLVKNSEICTPPPITKKTLELGSLHSPDFVCVPFKYNLGNFIEAMDQGANVIVQAGGGCRFAYYGEVQNQILKDLGYKFEFYSLANEDAKMNPFTFYRSLKKMNGDKLSFFKYAYYMILTALMVLFMDKIDIFIRKNIGFETNKNSFLDLKEEVLESFSKTKGFISLIHNYFKYKKRFRSLPINKSKDVLKVGVIGELYTSIEPFSSYNIEYELAKMNVEIDRFTDLTYLMITKRFNLRFVLGSVKKYLKYAIGADGTDNVARTKWLGKKKYDGIIHTKPFGCTPEVGAIPIITKVAEDYNIPVIFLSFDGQTSEEGIRTRLEAFYDMIKQRKEALNEK